MFPLCWWLWSHLKCGAVQRGHKTEDVSGVVITGKLHRPAQCAFLWRVTGSCLAFCCICCWACRMDRAPLWPLPWVEMAADLLSGLYYLYVSIVTGLHTRYRSSILVSFHLSLFRIKRICVANLRVKTWQSQQIFTQSHGPQAAASWTGSSTNKQLAPHSNLLPLHISLRMLWDQFLDFYLFMRSKNGLRVFLHRSCHPESLALAHSCPLV